MRSLKIVLIGVILIALLSGCGLRGPLYLPDGTTTIKPDSPDDIDKQTNSSKDKSNS